jgi:hypothetical protein
LFTGVSDDRGGAPGAAAPQCQIAPLAHDQQNDDHQGNADNADESS